MNPNLELSIREAVGVITGVIHQEIADRYDSSRETENARSIFFKLLYEYEIAFQSQICVKYNIQINQLRNYIERADAKIYQLCEKWIAKINHPTYGE